uniref:Reverse transcriptase Ty1/copia-type domain-containing protein n=1 Tax=Tanacetum cinerariifolium TaxID=118510 RepID=A0A699H5E9_TANCI|nr:hypothetical protein [Tanacetum cinerariifolium]
MMTSIDVCLPAFYHKKNPRRERDIGTKWVFRNKKDERGIVVRNKARLVAQGKTQEEGINYEEVFALVARIEAIRLVLAYASFMGFMVYQMDVKSDFLYGTIKKEVYVYQPLGFKDLDYLDKIYVDDIIFGSTNKDLCKSFEKLMKDKFQKSSMGELTFFLDGKSARTPIDTEKLLHKDPDVKRIFRYLKGKPHLGLWYPQDSPFNLVAYSNSHYAGVCLDRKSTTGGCQFLGCRLISWQCKKQTVVVTSSTKAEYVATGSCCAQVLWIQNQLLDYGAKVGDLSSHSTNYSSPALTQKVFANMRRVGKGFSGVDTLLFEGMIVAQQDDDVADEDAASVAIDDVHAAADEPTLPSPTPTIQPPPPSQDLPSTSQIAQSLEITKLKQMVKKLERKNKLKVSKLKRLKRVGTLQRVDTSNDTVMDDVSKQGRIIASMDADEDVTLMDVADIAKEVAIDAEIKESADVQGRQAESQAQIYQTNLEHAKKVLSMQDDKVEPAELQKVVEVVTTAKLITKVVTASRATITAATTLLTAATITTAHSAARKRKGVVIRDLEETATPSIISHSEPKSKDKGKGILDDVIDQVQRKEKEDNATMRYQALKRKPQTKAQAKKNMMIYLRNMAGFKMDYFKGMSYDDIHLIFQKKFNSNVAFLEKTREQMEEEDNKALKRTNDVYTEATPLDRKVPVVDYEIYTENNKPYYKIITADGKGQKLEIVRVLWSAHYNIYNYTDDLAGREKISTYKDDAVELRLLEQSATVG